MTGRTFTALQRNAVKVQERILALEQQATVIRSWQPDIVIGTLQTPAYTSAITGKVVPDWQDLRDRRRALVDEPSREWRLLMHEKALTWGLTSAAVMVEQLDHLAELSRLPQMRIGLVPAEPTIRPGPPPAGAFHIYDAAVAIAATDAGTSFLDSEPIVSAYVAMFDGLEQGAVYDDAARHLIARIRKAWT